MSQSAMTQHTVTSRWSEFASSWWREATQNFRLGQSHVARHTTRSGSPTASVSVSLSTMNFFKSKQRTPPDLIRGLRDAIPRLESGAPGGEARRKVRQQSCWGELIVLIVLQANEDVSKNLQQIKAILYGDGGMYEIILRLLLYWSALDQILYQNLSPSLHKRHTIRMYYICLW